MADAGHFEVTVGQGLSKNDAVVHTIQRSTDMDEKCWVYEDMKMQCWRPWARVVAYRSEELPCNLATAQTVFIRQFGLALQITVPALS